MRSRGLALVLIVLSVLVQTTLFSSTGFRPFRVAPDIVMLFTIVIARWLDDDAAILVGFTGGLLMDLLGTVLLGWRALTLTVVAYAAVRARTRFEFGVVSGAVGVMIISLIGMVVFAVIGTLFGEQTLAEPEVLRRIVLVPVYSLLLALVVQPIVGRVLVSRQTRSYIS